MVKDSNTTTIIIGGSRGLGLALKQCFEQAGHDVFELSRSGSSLAHIPCDLAQADAADLAARNCFSGIKTTNVNLIINAGTLSPFGHLAEQQADLIDQHLSINIQGTLRVLMVFVQIFQQWEGRISVTYMTSGAARRAIPGLALYSASKAFFERYIDTMSEEQKAWPSPIRFLVINPGVMKTEMQTEIRTQNSHDFPMVDWWQTLYKEGKLAEPSDIASVCFDLITSNKSGYHQAQIYLS